ncbi:MAG: TonB-dependent receptor [Hyphomicrobium sp.]|uniref:TonB-dependent receptor n=1 Tax=Hyphomicrobium sp. TaxID=82 RepID=UPI0025C3C42D|nr:TonB-dependent receptor [Hyphomicrobium sp.]MBZ0211962.1 TonB-dependent receptor [Hyphomicrobium sp.]
MMGAKGAAAQTATETQGREQAPVQTPAETPADPPKDAAPVQQKAAKPSAALPDMIVEASPKPAKKKTKAVAKPKAGAVVVADPSAQAEQPDPVTLGQSLSDTGTTVLSGDNARARTLGGGDANTFVRNLPNVQYQNDTNEDAGMSGQKELDTRPMQFTIMGGKTYENNIILNGVSINTNTGPIDNSNNMFTDNQQTVITDNIYGLHPQTVYVPIEFVGQATIIDSNASAKYGEFLGGAVIYDLAQPPTDRYHASVSYSRHTDEMVHYIIGTKTGTNPNGVKHPEFTKSNLAVSVGAPITNDWSFIAQASRKTVETSKQKIYELYNKPLEEDSDNIFFRFATAVKTDIGRFVFDSSLTKYHQLWENAYWRDAEVDIESHGWTNQIEHRAKLDQIVAPGIGLGGVNIMTRGYFNDGNTYNDANGNVSYSYISMRRRRSGNVWSTTFETDDFKDWCREVPTSTLGTTAVQNNTSCRDGSTGDIEQGQTDIGLQHEMTGRLLWGTFLLGGEARSIEGRRARPEEYISYSSWVTATGNTSPNSPASGSFNCPPGDELCTSEYYNRIKTITPAFETSATVDSIHLFSEIDQTLDWFNFRTGVRFDYDDYQKNPNLSPRVAATVTPFNGLSFTAGYNRYYQGEALYYAVRDGQPRSQAWTRTHVGSDVPADYTMNAPVTNWKMTANGLDTPYKDEYTATARILDPLAGGQFRVRYAERHGKDEYSSDECGSSLCNVLTNNGSSYYESVTAEYSKYWHNLKNPLLSSLGISANITWADQEKNTGTYYYDADLSDEVHIEYKGQYYTADTFKMITGNLDIPVRVGATLTTSWFNDALFVDFNAGYNFAYEGVYDTDEEVPGPIPGVDYHVYDDRTFSPTLMVDLHAQYNVSEMAAIELEVNNLLDTAGNSVATNTNPWVRGRSFWLGTKLRM